MGALTTEQTDTFRKEGYLIFESLFSLEECEAVKADIDAIEEARRSGGPSPWSAEDSTRICSTRHTFSTT